MINEKIAKGFYAKYTPRFYREEHGDMLFLDILKALEAKDNQLNKIMTEIRDNSDCPAVCQICEDALSDLCAKSLSLTNKD